MSWPVTIRSVISQLLLGLARGTVVRIELVTAVVGLLITQSVTAQQSPAQEGYAAFRQAVEVYQMFVVAHCVPDEVRAYVAARADRDRTFFRSLGKTALEADYRQAVADRAEQDNRTVYECMGPPPPPPPPPGMVPPPPILVPSESQHQDPLAEYFAAGDRQFAEMVRIRDELIGPPHK